MELIDRDVLFNSFNDCSCECGVCQYSLDGLPCGLIENAPTVEAIPKADYENRLKADMVAMLTEIQLEIEEYDVIGNHSTGSYEADLYNGAYSDGMSRAASIVGEKIDKLKETNT